MKKAVYHLNFGLNRFSRILWKLMLLFILLLCFSVNPQTKEDINWRTVGILNANQLGLVVYNYGCFGHDIRTPSFEWPKESKIHYGKRFGLIVGGEVRNDFDETVKIVSHSLDIEDANADNRLWWAPVPGYCANYEAMTDADKETGFMAKINQPRTWGTLFPQDDAGNLLWPGQFGAGKTVADAEIYFKMDDRFNIYDVYGNYTSFKPDGVNHGLGIEVTGRGYEFVTPVAEDMLFLVYELRNKGFKTLPKLVTGIFGDPEVGGRDDGNGDFVSMSNDTDYVFFWDKNSGVNLPATKPVGYLGYAFLETPGDALDGVDNDKDGLIDESQMNQVDDDHDWQATDAEAGMDTTDFDGKSDDVGADGIPNTGDTGENNGQPDPGEPDYEFTDLDEVDETGMTSMSAVQVASVNISDRNKFWNMLQPGKFESNQGLNLCLLMGAGYFSLLPDQTQRLSLLCLLSEERQLLLEKIAIAEKIYQYNFNFLKAPELPVLQAEPRDKAVLLTWDENAEQSFDPILGNDFEGYAVYRSTDGITWGPPITNARGKRIYDAPIARFDLDNEHHKGYHPVEVEGVRFYLGDNSGLSHKYLDENLMNGITYYYAVTAYDTGSVRYGIPPRECSKIIGNSNVVLVTPRSNPASNLEQIYVVPNPYVASSLFDRSPTASVQGITSGRCVMFMNLPESCVIRIYTTVGELVREITHEALSGDTTWDLQNHDGLDVATGTYIYHVDAPGLGSTIGRIAIIK